MENQNSVAFIGKINEILAIDGADKIVIAKINGWSSIVAKDVHKVGDLVLTITTDAVIPEKAAIAWGVDRYLRKGNRVRTVKLKGVYSECILIPLKDCPQGLVKFGNVNGGEDMMSNFDIYKYEPPAIVIQEKNGRKHKYHQNPNFHIYHKFPNQKNTPNMFNEDDDVVITRKIHGSNFRASIVKKHKLTILDRIKKFFGNKWAEYTFAYGSHNVEKGSDSQGFYSTDIWREMCDKYKIKDNLWNLVKSNFFKDNLNTCLTIYGEVYGLGVQGDKYNYGLYHRELLMFDIEHDGVYLDQVSKEVYFNYLGLPMVEKLYQGKWSKEIQEKYLYDNIKGTNTPEEGIVVTHMSGDRKKISKVINPNYLIFSEKWVVPDSH